MKLKIKKSCFYNGTYYDVGDELDIKDKKETIRLNEKGFIEPLTQKQIQNIGREPKSTI